MIDSNGLINKTSVNYTNRLWSELFTISRVKDTKIEKKDTRHIFLSKRDISLFLRIHFTSLISKDKLVKKLKRE